MNSIVSSGLWVPINPIRQPLLEWLIIIGKVGRNQACGNRLGFPPGLELLMEFKVPDLQPLATTQPLPAPTNDKTFP